MIDLPVLLEAPTARRADRSALRPAPAGIPWPWWMAPARLVGRIRPAVYAAASADAMAFDRLPRLAVAIVPPLLVLALSAVVSLSNASTVNANPSPHVNWLKLTVDSVYTESPLFLLFAVGLGMLSPAIGVLLVAVFGVTDIAAATAGPYELQPFPAALAGRLVGLWVLWLVAVEVPTFTRQLSLSWQRIAGNRYAVATVSALASGAFVWIWTQAATALIRPVFTWSHLISGVTLEAVQPLQTAGLVFAVLGALVAGLVVLWRGPDGLLIAPAATPAEAAPGGLSLVGRLVKRVLVAALLTIGLGGLISWPLEAVVLFAVLLGAAPLARYVADRTPLGAIVLAQPPLVRVVVAAALSFGAAQLTIAPLYRFAAVDTSGRYPEFFSVVAAIAIGIILVQLATTPGSGRARPRTISSSVVVVLVLGGTFLLIALGAPPAVAADNCASLSDCWGTPFLAALAGGSMPMAMYYGSGDLLKWAGMRYQDMMYSQNYNQKYTNRAVLGVRG